MKNVAKITFVIIGSLIGAGFASGKEIYSFFGRYGEESIKAVLLSSILTGLIITKTLIILQKYPINSYQDFLVHITKKNRNSKLIIVLNLIIKSFILISFYVMISGFSTYFKQEFKLPIILGSLIIALTSFFIFCKDIKGIINANVIIVPILIVFIFILGIKTFEINMIDKIEMLKIESSTNWVISAILYSSYNSILLIPILIPLKEYIVKKSHIFETAIVCTIILGIMSFSILVTLTKIDILIDSIEIPIIYVANLCGKIYPYIYGFVIVAAIFTSAICTGYSFLKDGEKENEKYFLKNVFLCISSVFVAHLGFSNLVNVLYPIFGYLGIIQILFLFCSSLYKQKVY